VTYGTSEDAHVRAVDVESHGLRGFSFLARFRGAEAPAHAALPGAHLVHAALAAIAVAMELGFEFEEAVEALGAVERGGRVQVLQGIEGTTILDDCYNANPASMMAALDLLRQTEGRHVAVLGDMLELGTFETEGHRLVGERAGDAADWVITVGERARVIGEEARRAGLDPERVESVDSNAAAVERLRAGLRSGDFVLVKASHGMRLDEVVNALRAVA
jgi:UDP-N-acetylmuramoyl-tripeptide--D-alanyl-D-alanine ligase